MCVSKQLGKMAHKREKKGKWKETSSFKLREPRERVADQTVKFANFKLAAKTRRLNGDGGGVGASTPDNELN